jgi:UTP--glucose-1-phosphate uridylyltransferase
MGCQGPKSLVRVTESSSFMDLILQQLNQTRQRYNCEIPLVLMNSPTTHEATLNALKGVELMCFVQHEFPRIDPRTLGCFDFPDNPDEEWYPPGHGNLYLALVLSGVCDALLNKGIRTLMVSNSDNLGPDISPKILGYMRERQLEFLMEATPKTKLDVKGGSPVRIGSQLTLLERSQIDHKHHHYFEDISQFSTFNTNTLWIQLEAIKHHIEALSTQLPMIVNAKRIHDNPVIQLETAMGSALGVFKHSEVLVVPRDRFIAVKHCSDLMLLRSDAIEIHDGCWFSYNDTFRQHEYASITLGDHFRTVADFESRVRVIPSLKGVTSLHLDGDIVIADKMVFEGDVSIKTSPGQKLILP